MSPLWSDKLQQTLCVCVCHAGHSVFVLKGLIGSLVPLKSTTERNEHSSNIWLSTFSSSSFLFGTANLLLSQHFSLEESQQVVQSYVHQKMKKSEHSEACVSARFPTIPSDIQGERERGKKKDDQKKREVCRIAASLSAREHLSQKAKSRAARGGSGGEDTAVNHTWLSPAPLIRKVNNKENR